MKAMILAAGLGTRLRPLTDTRPKALARIDGSTLLEITLERLRECGVTDVIVNVHHFADMVVEYLEANHGFGMRVEVSHEEALLDTGGGLKKAAWFFLDRDDPSREDAPFILHNVDVVSTVDLERMVEAHRDSASLATLAMQDRDTSRYLLFDQDLQLCGRRVKSEGKTRIVRDSSHLTELAFSGIHVISPRMLPLMSETCPGEVFSIIDAYLDLAGAGSKITSFRADEYEWRDVGTWDGQLS
jgi:mannose-1-phosphate guanylyltransferase